MNSSTSPGTDPWWRNEDWLAVCLGFLMILYCLLVPTLVLPASAWRNAEDLGDRVLSGYNLTAAAILGAECLLGAAVGVALLGGRLRRFAAGFPVVYMLAWLSQIIAGNTRVNAWGLEYVIFGLALGLFWSNLAPVPPAIMEAARTEYYIKTGLVLLGTRILFREMMEAGGLGMAQAFLVVCVVWYFCFWMSRKLHVDDEFSAMLSTAVSICGVSAAIAACGAIQGDRKKLSYVTSLVLIVAVPMMVIMPWIIKSWQIPDAVGGAWLGGTLDTSGSVVAAGSLISEAAMKTGVIVKLSQNVLIGLAAFLLSLWWTLRSRAEGRERPGLRIIWQRFPKFVIGFVSASIVFSFLLDPAIVASTRRGLDGLTKTWFALAFVSIGLETRFAELVQMERGRPALAFVTAQAFNVFWTLLLAYILFGRIH